MAEPYFTREAHFTNPQSGFISLKKAALRLLFSGAPAEIRTPDTLLKRQVLCLLSYWGVLNAIWLGWRDSNPLYQSQSLRCYHYTTSHHLYLYCQQRPGFCPAFAYMGWVKGLEPSTPGTTIRCSNQLSYTHHISTTWKTCRRSLQKRAGTPEGTRTPGPLLRRQLLYPPELQAHLSSPPKSEPSAAGPIWKGAAAK